MIEHQQQNNNNNFFTQAGEAPKIESIYAIALYDPKDGKIRHMHHVITPENASKKTEPQLLERDVIANAKKLGHNTDILEVLHIPNLEDPTSMYRVDVERKTLVKISEMTLSEILKNMKKVR